MSDFFKDHGEIIVAVILGLIGFGKVWQKNVDTEIRVKKIEDDESMSLQHCKERQSSCHMVQKAYHGNVEKDIEELREAFKAMKTCNDTQHNTIMSRSDTQHAEIMTHLLNGKK